MKTNYFVRCGNGKISHMTKPDSNTPECDAAEKLFHDYWNAQGMSKIVEETGVFAAIREMFESEQQTNKEEK
jgi:hypothetical protein